MTGRWTAAFAGVTLAGIGFAVWAADAPTEQRKPETNPPAVAKVAGKAPSGVTIPATVDGFKLSDFRGREVSFAEFAERKLVVVAFLGVECPLAKLYAAELVKLEKEYAPRGVAFVAIDPNRQDAVSEMERFAKDLGIEFPFLKDVGNAVADRFQATRTPEVFVLDPRGAVRYSGRIDDRWQIGVQRKEPTRRDLVAALDQALAGEEVTTRRTEPIGCLIGRTREPDPAGKVTYSKEIARIFQNRCVECHHAGDIAPFSLETYSEAAGWADMIAEVVSDGTMPPWHANPEHGKFKNDARLSPDEKAAILAWAEAGAPEGNPADLPPAKHYEKGWRIGTPDVVFSMADEPFRVPATGEVSYQYFVVDPGFTEDKWVQAAECIPGNRSVVHHIILSVRAPGRDRKMAGDVESDWLTATAPGAQPLVLPQGLAKKIPAGSRLIFQMHYTPNGTPQSDLSKVGLKFCDPKTVTREVGTQKAANNKFKIPAHAGDHQVEAWSEIKQDSLLIAMFPHMHLRGKAFRYEAVFPDGREQVLLDVPDYHFDWQNAYVPFDPIALPKGTKMHCTAVFDNSSDNPNNPDPSASVRWGDQTWEEMMIGYYDVCEMHEKPRVASNGIGGRTGEFLAKTAGKTPEVSDRVKELAAKALDSEEAFTALGLALREVVPQADRMDFAVVDAGMLSVKQHVQAKQLDRYLKGRGLTVPIVGLAVPKYAAGTEVVVHQKLADAAKSAPDLKLLNQAFSASLHAPVKVDGKTAIVNFWSTEPNAFPPEAVEYLQRVAALMTAGR